MYINGKWIKQGSILGPVGTPQSVKTLQFIRKDNVEVGSLEKDENNSSVYYISKIDELNDIISQYDIANGVPNSQNGEVYTMNIYHIDKEDATKLVAEETWWGQYVNNNWSLMLLTGEAVLSDSIVEDDIYAKEITYTASYLNKIIPVWDTESYY